MNGGKMSGGLEMRDRFKSLGRRYPTRIEGAVEAEMDIEMAEAVERTPLLSGDLRASAVRHPAVWNGKTLTCVISFGNDEVDYAVPVHENPEAFHPVGQWKYLESVLNESASKMAGRLASRLSLERDE